MIAWLITFAAMPGPGVIRIATETSIVRAEHAETASTAAPVGQGDRIETATNGWVELEPFQGVLVRLSAASSLLVDQSELVLLRGRVWIQGASASVRIKGQRVETVRGSSIVADIGPDGRPLVAVRGGRAITPAGVLERGFVLEGSSHRRGGQAILELVESEAKAVLGDRAQAGLEALRAFARSRRNSSSSVDEVVPSTSSTLHRARGPFFDGLDRATAVPPFFESEIPEPGPNLGVQVEFADELR
ncbi:MAG: hypothetical protein HYV07_15085 [Deltaproteobacteria bacterium]|nr:hypothetical protein [Deltaproteobacteria bacterium]